MYIFIHGNITINMGNTTKVLMGNIPMNINHSYVPQIWYRWEHKYGEHKYD